MVEERWLSNEIYEARRLLGFKVSQAFKDWDKQLSYNNESKAYFPPNCVHVVQAARHESREGGQFFLIRFKLVGAGVDGHDLESAHGTSRQSMSGASFDSRGKYPLFSSWLI